MRPAAAVAAAAPLPRAMRQTFLVGAGELGMASTSWLFARSVHAFGGLAQVEALRRELGPEFPVLDAVVGEWLAGHREPPVDAARVAEVLAGIERLLFVGVESDFLDALVPRLGGVELGLVDYSLLELDAPRLLSNYGGRVKLLPLQSFQRWAGARSAILTFAYGHDGHSTHVRPGWMRVVGPDVRAQFRDLVAWNVLRGPMEVYSRWMVESQLDAFSAFV